MKRKTRKKQEFEVFENCTNNNPHHPGQWHSVFGRPAPLMVELGAGRCDFSLGYAANFPHWNVLAIDRKAERLWAGGRRARLRGLENVHFLRTDVLLVSEIFAENEVDRLWITFPDPYPKKKHEKHRMTGRHFLDAYQKILRPEGCLLLKTDNAAFFDWSLEQLETHPTARLREHTRNLHSSQLRNTENAVLTFYEEKWIAEEQAKIHYLKADFHPET